ncbi:MAG: hypothetical protein ACSLE1_01915 [Sphingobium sp.]
MTDNTQEAVTAFPEVIGRLQRGDHASDGERLCNDGHEVPAGHPLYWHQQTSQYDDSDPYCLEHAIDLAVSDNGWCQTCIGRDLATTPTDNTGLIERLAQWLHDECDFDEAWTGRSWPEHPEDTGQRKGGFVKLVPTDVVARFREVASRLVNGFSSDFSDAAALATKDAEIAALRNLASSNLATMEEQRRRCRRWGQSFAELAMAIEETQAALGPKP